MTHLGHAGSLIQFQVPRIICCIIFCHFHFSAAFLHEITEIRPKTEQYLSGAREIDNYWIMTGGGMITSIICVW